MPYIQLIRQAEHLRSCPDDTSAQTLMPSRQIRHNQVVWCYDLSCLPISKPTNRKQSGGNGPFNITKVLVAEKILINI